MIRGGTVLTGCHFTLAARVHPTFVDVLDVYQDAAAIGIDIPIGLSEGEPHQCDLAARKAISPKGSSVIPAPDARFLESLTRPGASIYTYKVALALARKLTNKGLSQQTFHICPKIAEVNLAMTPELQQRVVEVHPEVSLWVLAGNRPMQHKKSRQAGYDERAGLLAERLDVSAWPRKEAFGIARPAKPDDLLDATVAAWTARRMAEMEFAWAPNKDASNALKHGMSFDDAKSVFDDPQHVEEELTRSNYGKRRRLAIGRLGSVVVTVIFTDRDGVRRLISARRARRDERERYRQSAETV